jgi:light-regulated signal transduction histidine kinase (bacteriophytochrome)
MTGSIGKIGGWEIDVVKGTSSWTDEVTRIQGLDPNIPASVELGYSLYSLESRPIIEKAVNEAINEGKPYDLELEIITTNGEHKLIRTTGNPELVNGKVVKVTGIFQDITELKKTEAEIKKLNDELEQRVKDRTAELLVANQELESFSYSVSHDLRAPIRAIDGFSQIISDEYSQDVNPEVLRYLEIVRANTRNMGTLVDDLLAFSRLGRQSVERQTVNAKRLVNEVVDEIRMANPNRKVEFVIGPLPDCQADINLLKQVFVNLISNAVKFTRKCENARVEIGAELQSLPNNNKEVEKFTKYCYYVRDNGIGFNMKYYDKLFGVFQRLHKTEDYEGTGVGLAIVKRVIEKHGGKVWAESQLNQGTTFYFVLGETNENGKTD